MSARTDRRRTGLSRERLIVLLLLALAVIVAVTAARLYFSGSLTLDALLVELGLKPPTVAVEDIPAYSGEPYGDYAHRTPGGYRAGEALRLADGEI